MYELNTKKIIKDLNIAVIADLHYSSKTSKSHLNKILKKVNKISPTHIVMPGDIIDGNIKVENINKLLNFLKKLKDIAIVIISIGNHDLSPHIYLSNEKENKLSYFDQMAEIDHVIILNDAQFTDANFKINFIGYTEPYENYTRDNAQDAFFKDINDTFNIQLPENSFNILLAHNPTNFENINTNDVNILKHIDLIISGHMHAGLIHPFLRPLIGKHVGLISPSKKLFPKRTVGQFRLDNLEHIIANPATFISDNLKLIKHFNKLYPVQVDQINIKSKQ